ncbi:MAG: SAM-dependent methyltransferase YrrT [Candidatus Carbobacillus altaicus]|uniref:SAM-dependent methyltransferase YrrT n=1 Tax=Candidatus Carbonibacillus altaicus TaxID=2163959 RepID=A0A2R6XZM5_9BACL|nr:MAG: SAM-dependent methyltransferase YrrT [Candidatus Carbobacillus altaicus]
MDIMSETVSNSQWSGHPLSEARFNALFDHWAKTYDLVVSGADVEYAEVFAGYDQILERVVRDIGLPSGALVVEIGLGTGNLTKKLKARGYRVIGVEPSQAMREEARRKIEGVDIRDGSFLHLPLDSNLDSKEWQIDAFVSTYAFHHLTDEEKEFALQKMVTRLVPKGKIVFADTLFVDETARQSMIEEARRRGFSRLERDLTEEFYPLLPNLKKMLERVGLEMKFEQLNRYVWLWKGERRQT